MKAVKTIITAVLLLFAITNATAQSEERFVGVYGLVTDQADASPQSIEIFSKDNDYYFRAQGAEAYKMTSWENGKELRITSQDGGKINDDGSVEVSLGADVRLFFENNQLMFEMSIPDIGTEKHILQKQ